MAYPKNSTVSEAIKKARLPRSHDIYWSQARKEEVVHAVRDKLITFDEARWRYLLSQSEFKSWEEEVDRNSDTPAKDAPAQRSLEEV